MKKKKKGPNEFFAVRKKILEQIQKDPEWNQKLEDASSLKEYSEIVETFCENKGLKIVNLK